jgi:O-antigen/teichoic acid export membrane protein
MTGVDQRVGDDTRRHLTHVARGGALGLVGAGVSAVAGFALVLVVTNFYSSEAAGQFFAVTSTFLLMAAIATLGTETGLGRFLLRYEAQDRHGDIPPTLRAAFRPTIACSVVLSLVVLLLADPLADLIGLVGEDGPASLRVLAVLLPFATVNTLALAGTRAFGRMRMTVLVDKIGRSSAQPLAVLLVSATGTGLLVLTWAWSVPYAVAAVVSSFVFRRFLQRRGTYEHTEPTRTNRELRREFWKFTWPRSITRISQMAIQRMDIILVAALRTPTEAAIYTAATRFVALGQFGTQAIQQVLQPKFTALLARKERESLREVYQVSAAWSMALAWPMYVVVGSAPLAYLALFGPEYADDGVAVVLLMALAMLFGVATGPADTLLLMSGRSALSLANSLTALALDITLCLVLIPRMGITGAAVAWAVAVVTRCTLAVVQTRLTMSIVSFGPAAGIVALANLLCFVVPLLVLGRFVEVGIATLSLALLVCVPVYVLALWLGRRRLMLSVLRGLVRRRRTSSAEEQVEAVEGVEDA